jgi:hypothetical protein
MKSPDARQKSFALHIGEFVLEMLFTGPRPVLKGLIGIDGPVGPVAVRIYFCEGLFQNLI